MTRDFTARVLAAVRRIPPGRVATYGDVAAMAGRPRASRAVGNIMRSCARPDIPCHRVIAAGGRIGGYGGSEALKRSLLIAEGVAMTGSRVKLQDCRMGGLHPSTKARNALSEVEGQKGKVKGKGNSKTKKRSTRTTR